MDGLINSLTPRAKLRYRVDMVAAIRQILTVQADGRLELLSPELRAGAIAEVIVLLPSQSTMATAAERIAALVQLRGSIGLTSQSADDWVQAARNERE